MTKKQIEQLFARLQRLREAAGLSPQALEERLILGPGWIRHIESGQASVSVQTLLSILRAVGATPHDLFRDIEVNEVRESDPESLDRLLQAKASGRDVIISFPYGAHRATYSLPSTSIDELNELLRKLRNGLASAATGLDDSGVAPEEQKATAIADVFLTAANKWPHVNPSDLWWFLVYRAYCDPFNHPATASSLDFAQSWKRTGGWALERVLVNHYGPPLRKHGLDLVLPKGEEKDRLISDLRIGGRVNPDKIDVFLTAEDKGHARCFGVVHVKASFAERRTDDVPLSEALIKAGYTSLLWTLDCKSTPSEAPINKGELGSTLQDGGDTRSDKRRDIEDDGVFSACISYNANTSPTPERQKAKARIFVCNFKNTDDAFTRFVLNAWKGFAKRS